jgi:hypothetical protein
MSDQVTDKSSVVELTQASVPEMMPPLSISPSDRLLRRIATLLFLLVAGMLTVFGYYASSICITVVLAAFLAILFDPLVVRNSVSRAVWPQRSLSSEPWA